jgi:basic membrane lipoprotein Med (substrate-binding protein (PBP1-ABC) superfamily)
MKKRLIGVLLALLMVASLVVGCAKQAATETASAADGAGIKVAVVANQKFGDNGPMDNMKAGVESMVEKHGIEAKYLESSAETFEEDVRAMAEAGIT